MLNETGKVISSTPDTIEIMITSEDACHSCSGKKVCGHRLLNTMHAGRGNNLRLDRSLIHGKADCQQGDEISLSMSESSMMLLSSLFYLAPLIFMGVMLLVMNAMSISEGLQVLFSVVFLLLGFAFLKRLVFPSLVSKYAHGNLYSVDKKD